MYSKTWSLEVLMIAGVSLTAGGLSISIRHLLTGEGVGRKGATGGCLMS